MKRLVILWLIFSCAGSIAQGPVVAPEILGTWAGRKSECSRPGPTTLLVSRTTVLRHNVTGHIVNGWNAAMKAIEVSFDPTSGGPHGLGVRTFSLSITGTTLHELKGGEVVMSRNKCDANQVQEGASHGAA